LVDAGMKELAQMGYCSNRVRQNLASVLTKDLKIDWRIGAEWFQFCLEDHCVAANWGNWQYFSGIGGDPKNRHFRTISQALRYDSTGAYVQKWLPALRDVAELEARFRPWDFQSEWGTPLVDPSSQYTWQDHQKLQDTGSVMGAELR
jgi:deoxyribodipyrimidine photo-lyase